MKAVIIDQYGGPEMLQVRDLPDPKPKAGEVLIRMKHAGINAMDLKTRKGDYDGSKVYGIHLPTQIGMEGAGVIEALGEGVTDFAVGDRVAYCLVWNSYAELAAVPAWRVAKVPDDLHLKTAGTSTFQGFTAHYLVNDVASLADGMTCLVHAAAGGVGQMIVSLAKRLGATVYGSVKDEAQIQLARDRGCDDVYLSKDGAFVSPILDATGGSGVDVVFDSVGKPTLRDDFRVTRKRGLVINFGASAGAVDDLNPAELGDSGSLFLTRPHLEDYLEDKQTVRRRAEDLYRQMTDGDFCVPVAKRYHIDEIHQAHEDVEAGRLTGKAGLDFV